MSCLRGNRIGGIAQGGRSANFAEKMSECSENKRKTSILRYLGFVLRNEERSYVLNSSLALIIISCVAFYSLLDSNAPMFGGVVGGRNSPSRGSYSRAASVPGI